MIGGPCLHLRNAPAKEPLPAHPFASLFPHCGALLFCDWLAIGSERHVAILHIDADDLCPGGSCGVDLVINYDVVFVDDSLPISAEMKRDIGFVAVKRRGNVAAAADVC